MKTVIKKRGRWGMFTLWIGLALVAPLAAGEGPAPPSIGCKAALAQLICDHIHEAAVSRWRQHL